MISGGHFHFLNKNAQGKIIFTRSPKTKAGYPVFAQIFDFFPLQPLTELEVLKPYLGLLGHFGSFWALLTILGYFGSSGPFWALWTILGHSGHSGPFWAILGTLGHFGPSGPFWALWAILGTLGHFGPSGPFWALWVILGPLGPLGHSVPYGPFWALWGILGPLGHFESFWAADVKCKQPLNKSSRHFWHGSDPCLVLAMPRSVESVYC